MFKVIIHIKRIHTISIFLISKGFTAFVIKYSGQKKELVTFHFEINEVANSLFQLN